MSDEIKPIPRTGMSALRFLHMRAAQLGERQSEPYHEPVGEWEMERKDQRGTVTEWLLSEAHYGKDAPVPENLAGVIAWLQRYLAAVPEDRRDSAEFKIDSVGGYEGEHHVEVNICYKRPETDEEWTARKADVAARLTVDTAKREAAERATFERLQAKFEPKP